MLLAKALTGEELARQLITVISTELSVPPHLVVAGMRDRATVNNVAMRTIGVIYNNIMDIGCFLHTLDHVGEKMHTPILNEFMTSLICLFSRSPKAKLCAEVKLVYLLSLIRRRDGGVSSSLSNRCMTCSQIFVRF